MYAYRVILHLSDVVNINSSSPNDVLLFSEPKNIIAQLERILQKNKIEINHLENNVLLDSLLNTESNNDLFEYLSKQSIEISLFNNFIQQTEQIFPTPNPQIHFSDSQSITNISWQDPEITSNYIILSLPLVLTILINSENLRINKQAVRKSLSSVFSSFAIFCRIYTHLHLFILLWDGICRKH